MRRVLQLLFLLLSALAGLDTLDRLQIDYDQGRLSFDDYMIYQLARLRADSLLPPEYRAATLVKCGTPIMRLLMEKHSELSAAAREILARLGVDFSYAFPRLDRPPGLDMNYDSGFFRFHYTLSGNDAIDATDDNGDGIPDYINTVAEAFSTSYETEIDTYGFAMPPSDGGYPDNGGNELYDIYVHSLTQGYYGLTNYQDYVQDNENTPDVTEINAYTSYIEIQNSYAGFPDTNSEIENIQVTAAHEFFHAVQLGYDGWEKTWLLESTATWMEDEVFDDINDNYQYLSIWFDEPHIALDYTPYHDYNPDYDPSFDSDGHELHWYGSWIFFRYISEHVGAYRTIRQIFEQSVKHNSYKADYCIQTIDEALQKNETSFQETLGGMVIANQILSSDPVVNDYSYAEAEAYRHYGVKPHYEETLFLSDSSYRFDYDGTTLMRNASHYIRLPGINRPIKISFSPVSDTATMQAKCIIQTASGKVLVYGIGDGTTIPIPGDADSVAIAVVTGNADDASFNYSLTLVPEIALPAAITLYQNFPNPVLQATTFRFFLMKVEPATLTIYDLLGRQVDKVRVAAPREGFNDVPFEVRELASGIYVVKLETKAASVARKFAIIKERD